MKRGRSTGKPTKEEAEWIVAVKEGPCLACLVWRGIAINGCDAHHILSGGRRIGHMATIGLCAWHHRGITLFNTTPHAAMRKSHGPSLMDGSKKFHESYGSDSELLSMQRSIVIGDQR